MNDLKLDPLLHDLVIENGDFVLLNSEASVARQSLTMNLLFYKGEWFLDLQYGVPYLQTIVAKGATKTLVDTIMKGAILGSYRIDTIEEFTSELVDSRYSIFKLVATTIDGEIISITNQNIF